MLPPKVYMDYCDCDHMEVPRLRGWLLGSPNLSRLAATPSRPRDELSETATARLANKNAGTPALALPLTRKSAQTSWAPVA